MSKLKELERTIDSLPEKDYSKFRRWFLERDWTRDAGKQKIGRGEKPASATWKPRKPLGVEE